MKTFSRDAKDLTEQLVKSNLQNTTEWVSPEQVIDFIDKTYNYLVGDEPSTNKPTNE